MSLASGPSPTQSQLFTLIRAFLLRILPDTGWEVVLGQANRVPQPPTDGLVSVIFRGLNRLATTVDTWSEAPDPVVLTHQQDVAAKIQLQVFGEDAVDAVNTITTLLRSSYACQFFAGSGIAPLFCDDGQQVPFITGETQYQDRYIVEAQFEMSVTMATTQQFADTWALTVELPVDLMPVA